MAALTAIIVLISAALLVWRRPKPRPDEERSRNHPTTRDAVADASDGTVELDSAARPPKAQPLNQREKESAGDSDVAQEKEPPAVPQPAASTQSQSAESQLSSKANGIEPIETVPAEPGGLLPPANSDEALPSGQTSLDLEKPPASDETAATDGLQSIAEPTVPAHAATAVGPTKPTPGKYPETEPGVPETADAEDAAESAFDELAIDGVAQAQHRQQLERKVRSDPEKQGQPREQSERRVRLDRDKPPQRYRPPSQKPPRQPSSGPANQESKRAAPSEVSLEIRVGLKFNRFGFCDIGLLPQRTPELDDEIAVKFEAIPFLLVSQEDWYQELHVENIGRYLTQGIELTGILADQRPARWLLSGRDLYVLANHQSVSFLLSTSRLLLGRSHAVLCRTELLQQVEAVLREAGCEGYTKLDESHGLPSGWIGLRGVLPTKAIPLELGSDLFYAIKPAPDIEINLEGGVWLRASAWMAGYPPRIKLFGASNEAVKVLIDGKEAQQTEQGFLTADGCELPGPHLVYCEGLSRSCSYSIEEPPDSWQAWPAYHFGRADICGPLVQLPEAAGGRIFAVPMSNPLLLGAEPGQLFRCTSRNVARWKGFVPFDVVWALPAQPLLCDKTAARILQFADMPVAPTKTRASAALAWSKAILDASRKGLILENGSPDSTLRWSEYKRAARNIRRAAR